MHPTPSTSASPAPFRVTSATKRADGPSPSKRRKLTTPPLASSSSSSFSNLHQSGPTSDPQLDTERRASSSRVLSVWSALGDKYARRLDEDDIVDLRSGGLVKDRGVLSSKDGTWDIGCFADPKKAQAHKDASLEGDEDEDEIGGWGSEPELDHQFNPVHVPPVRELDPEDAKDLREFMAAEEARKCLQGTDDFSEDDTRGGDYVAEFDPNVDNDESIVEIEVGSAPALPATDSDDELAGYDETVGEGALLWEVETDLSNCSEPLGVERGMTPKPLHASLRRNQTPAQLRTPPLSRSSMKESKESNILMTSPRPFRKPPPHNLLPPSPAKPRKASSSTMKAPFHQHSRDDGTQPVAHLSTGKGKEQEMSLSPTKKLIAEVTLPIRRAKTLFKQGEDARTQAQGENDDAPRMPAQPRQSLPKSSPEKAPTDMRASKHQQPSTPSPSKRAGFLRQSSSYHPPPAPSLPSHEFWQPNQRSAHTPVPTFPVPYAPPPNHARESSLAPHPEAQFHVAQAMQSLSYLAFGSPPTPSSSTHPSHLHSPHNPPHNPPTPMPPPSSWSYPTPYFPYQSPIHPHPPCLYPHPPFPFPYPYTTHAHLAPSSSIPSLSTPDAVAEPPSSPPDSSSSPLSRKGKRKRVSFPQDAVQSESESGSGTDTDTDTGTDAGEEVLVSKGKGEGKIKEKALNTTTLNERSRRNFVRSSKASGGRSRNPSPRRK